MATLNEAVRIVAREGLLHRRMVLACFIAVSLSLTAIGLNWKKNYASYTTVLFEQRSIFEPLMEGAAVQSTVIDRAKIAREIIFGRTIIEQVGEAGGYFAEAHNPSDRDLVIELLRQKTEITNVGESLVKIEFSDPDPERAFQSTRLMGELFIGESLKATTAESETAVSFVDSQVREYEQKLNETRAALERFHQENAEYQALSEEGLNQRITDLRGQLEENRIQLKEAEIRKASLERQLAGERAYSTMTQSGDRSGAIALKEAELARLRLGYQDQHPDIVRLKQELAEIRSGKMVAGEGGPTSVVAPNPVHQALRQELYNVSTLVSTLDSRVKQTDALLIGTVEQARRAAEVQNRMAELQRHYEMTRDVTADLQRRRETARVSLELNRQQQGLALKIVEPAFLPGRPKGIGLRHFAVAGLLLGLALPLGFLYWREQLDPRVRDGSELRGGLGARLVGVIPHLATPAEARSLVQSFRLHALAGLATTAAVITIAVIGHPIGVMP